MPDTDPHLRILFVEDVPTDAELAAWTLRKEGFAFTSTRVDTQGAFLDALETFRPDLIISDYSMPDFDGMTALKLSIERSPDTPFIILTGSMNEEIAVECLKTGAWNYILKDRQTRLPFAVKEALDKRDALRAKAAAEEALLASEKRYREVVENASDLIATMGMDRRFKMANTATMKLTGYSLEELNQLSYLDLVLPEQHQRVQGHYLKQIADKAPRSYIEFPFRSKQGEVVWVGQSANIMMDGQTVVGFQLIARDVTERKRAEEELRESETRFRTLFEGAIEGILVANLETKKFCYANPAICRMLQYSADELLEMSVFDIHPQDAMNNAIEIFETQARIQKTSAIGLPCLRKDGTVIYVDISGSTVILDGVPCNVGFFNDITERKQAEEALRKSEAQLLNASKMAHLGPWEYDVLNDTFLFNDAFYAIFRTTAEEVGGYSMSSTEYVKRFVHPEDAPVVGMETRKAIESNDPNFNRQLEHRIIYADGEIGYITVRFFIIKDETGKTIKTYGVNQDITERKRAEEELQKTETFLRTVMSNAPITIFTIDNEGIFTLSEGKGLERVGLKPGENVGVSAHGLFDSLLFVESNGNVTNGEDVIRRVLAGETINATDELNGVYFDNYIGPLRDKEGKIIGMVGVATDVTERMRAEEELRESEERYRSLFADNRAVMYQLDPISGEIIDANQAASRFYGYSHEQLTGMKIWDINTSPKEQVLSAMHQIASGESTHWLFQHRLASGEIRNVEIYSGPIALRGKTIIFAIVHDLTEKKRLEEQVRQVFKMETVGKLASGVAHDFNNLLTVISGHADMAMMFVKPEEPVYDDLKEILTASERAAALTRQLLAFSRKKVPESKMVNLNTIVRDLLKMLGRLIGEDVNVINVPDKNLWNIKADPGQIEQVIINLATNARDAMPDGGKLTLKTENVLLDAEACRTRIGLVPGKYVLLTVTDTGHGMTKETINQIFEPFYTTKESGKGTGLGLSMVFGIVKQGSGYIEVDSEVGRGSSFKIYIPRYEEAVTGINESNPSSQADTGSLKGSETILVVEDDPGIRVITQRTLESQGYRVITARSGDDALATCEHMTQSVDLVLSDVVLPGMSGVQLVSRLRDFWPGLKVIYMSGYTADSIMKQGVFAPGTEFIGKPFQIVELLKKVRDVLGG